MKNKRHAKILEIIQSTNTVTQSDLTEKLRECGFDVTQATVSRDIKALGLIKVSTGKDGYKYQQPSATPTASRRRRTRRSSATRPTTQCCSGPGSIARERSSQHSTPTPATCS